MIASLAPMKRLPSPIYARSAARGALAAGLLLLVCAVAVPAARAQTAVTDDDLQEAVSELRDRLVYPGGALAVVQGLLKKKYSNSLDKLGWLFSSHVDPQVLLGNVRHELATPMLLGPTHPDLVAVFQRTFPGYSVPAGGFEGHYLAQARRLMKTYRRVLAVTRALGQQARTTDLDLKDLREAIRDSAGTWQKARDLGLQISARTAEEMILLQQALAFETMVRALVGARGTNERATARAALSRALGLPPH